jgi:putative ABC transport system substrate-binding protein
VQRRKAPPLRSASNGCLMNRRSFISLLGAVLTRPATAWGEQTLPFVGFVFSGTASSAAAPFVAAFKLGLEEAGFIEGKNVALEYHFPGGNDESLPGLFYEYTPLASGL